MAAGTEGPFVGRAAEVAVLAGRLAGARAGDGGLVLVSGPAGIGKTRTVEVATAGEPAVVWGRCVDDPGAPPLWPWRRVLRARPDVGTAVAEALAAVDVGQEPRSDLAAARFRLVATATEALLAAAEPDGLVLVLEDLHWADEMSLRLLRHLAGEASRSRLLVVGTYRDPAGAVAGERLDEALPDLLRWPGTQPIPLRPLTEDDVRAYLAGAGPPAAEAVARAHRRSGGNPLYLRAVARLPPGTGAPGNPAGSELRALVRLTLAGLDGAALDLLGTAAVLGEEVDAALLSAVSARPVEEVRRHLDSAVRAGVLTAVPDAPGRRRFLHAVVRDTVYADLPPSSREDLHRRAAEAWEEFATRDDTAAGIVAGHWLRAAAGPDSRRRAAHWARIAAAVATRSLALDEAAGFLRTAVATAGREGGAEEQRAELLVELATAEFRAGRIGESLEHAAEASDVAARRGRPDLLAQAALAVHDVGSPPVLREVVRLVERALAEPDPDRSPAVRARLLSSLASALCDSGRGAAAVPPATEALLLAETSGDPEAVVDAVHARMKTAPDELGITERLRLGRLAVEHSTRAGRPLAALWGHKWRIDALLEAGDVPGAEEELARVAALSAASRLPMVRWHELRMRAALAALVGRFAEAVALNEAAGAFGASHMAQDLSAAGMSHAFRLQHALVTGDLSGWDTEAALRTLAAANDLPIVAVCEALIALLLGRREDAEARYEQLRARLPRPDFAAFLPAVANLVPLVEAFSDRTTAETLTRLILPHRAAVAGAEVYCTGSAAGLLGRLAVVAGRPEEAVGWFEAALADDTRTGARPSLVLGRIGLAGALLTRGAPGDAPRAGELARAAADEARRLGMPGPARTAAALADRARLAVRAADPLSGREREIAGLVAQALTNRQIAARLVVSERTVESHVRNILAKLGLANRTEIATATVAREGAG